MQVFCGSTPATGLFVGATNDSGEFRAGLVASWVGAVPAALAGGIGTLMIVALWTKLFPQLLRVDRPGRRSSRR